MALNLVSPGVSVREIDLTTGAISVPSRQIGGFAGPFKTGPVNDPVTVNSEADLLNIFGRPSPNDGQSEYWLTASSYLSYGGSLRVIRTDNDGLANATSLVGAATTVKITSREDYDTNHQNDTAYYFASKTPGSWSNELKVCVIDHAADQIIGLSTSNPTSLGAVVGNGVTVALTGSTIIGSGTTNPFTGFLKGVITKVNTSSSEQNTSTIEVKILSRVSSLVTSFQNTLVTDATLTADVGVSTVFVGSTIGINTSDTFSVAGIATNIPLVSIGSTFVVLQTGIGATINSGSTVTFSRLITTGGEETEIEYVENYRENSFLASDTLRFLDTSGNPTGSTAPVISVSDWYNNQTLGINNAVVFWRSLAPKPGTSQFSSERNSKNDEVHIVVVDDGGKLSGVSGNILEKFISLSKASDGKITPNQSTYYKNSIADRSNYIYGGIAEIGSKSVITSSNTPWGTETQDKKFNVVGNKSYTLTNGKDYNGEVDNYRVSLSDIVNSYSIFSDVEEYSLDYLICGPSGGASIYESQAKASQLISIADGRKDCIACISPHKNGVVNQPNTELQTKSIIEFFEPLQSSSYAVFDSGYKYMYDRFNNRYEYIPCNGDIAGIMARTFVNSYPWYSPAGPARGSINNAVKLAFNPNQFQRDRLYTKRVNPIIVSPGSGIILFGDKTAFGQTSAFDRINVRRLFLAIEKSIEVAARSQLFEFNDIITRTNFLNIVEPYLRDVKGKRGITDFLVVCDESNNTPDIIDSNQFKADIYIKPARSINFIGLTFVATRTGVSFEEFVGSV